MLTTRLVVLAILTRLVMLPTGLFLLAVLAKGAICARHGGK